MAIKKNQHYVPKLHLKLYSKNVNKKQIDIWLVKNKKIIQGASIKDQCAKNYFYGEDLKIENFLSGPEGLLGSTLNSITIKQSATEEELERLLFFWTLQHLRSERSINEQITFIKKWREEIIYGCEITADLISCMGPEPTSQSTMEMGLKNIWEFYEILLPLKKVLLINKSKIGFFLSDNPACIANKYTQMKSSRKDVWGLKSPGCYLYMPINPNLAFFAYDHTTYALNGKVGNFLNINSNDATILNQLSFLMSNNILVLPPNTNEKYIEQAVLPEIDAERSKEKLRNVRAYKSEGEYSPD